MKKAEDYRAHAAECRSLALQMPLGEQRAALERMAQTWEGLADDRAEMAARPDEPGAEPAGAEPEGSL